MTCECLLPQWVLIKFLVSGAHISNRYQIQMMANFFWYRYIDSWKEIAKKWEALFDEHDSLNYLQYPSRGGLFWGWPGGINLGARIEKFHLNRALAQSKMLGITTLHWFLLLWIPTPWYTRVSICRPIWWFMQVFRYFPLANELFL